MKLKNLLVCFGFVATQALANFSLPLNACTSYSPRLISTFGTCADFTVTRAKNGCMKVKGVCPACVTYQGDLLEMWLPEFMVEVSPHIGRSIFAESTAGAALKLHLTAAKAWWDKSFPSTPLTASGSLSQNSHSSTWHARILPVPFGAAVNTYPPLRSSAGVGVPVCYSSLSELMPNQWKYGQADLPIALAQSFLTVPQCYLPLGAAASALAQGALAYAPSPSGIISSVTGVDIGGFPNGCARPIFDKEAVAKSLSPSSDAWSMSKRCIGTLGALIPRTGEIASDEPFKAALTAGVKFASATSDFFGDSKTGGWELSDKWQLIYPPSLHNYCFRPGQASQILEMPFGVNEDGITRASDNAKMNGALANSKSGSYVFLVWRKRETCQEPLGSIWKADYELQKAKNMAICAGSSAFPD